MQRWAPNYCTLFDSGYLSRGLAMLESLHRVSPEARVAVFCFDELTYERLSSLGWSFVLPVRLSELEENPRLAATKPGRNAKEYCWTSTPFTVLHCLTRLGFPSCIYIDADLLFFSSPEPVFAEAESASVLLTEHRYTPRFDNSALSGNYCVQFTGFRADEAGLTALRWWSERCADWCFDRVEEGRFGDQKYLDGWETKFPGVHSVAHVGAGVAPWNVQQYEISHAGAFPEVAFQGKRWPLVFYHFHGLRLLGHGLAELSEYPLPASALPLYERYLEALRRWESTLASFPGYRARHATHAPLRQLAARLLRGTLNYRKF